MLPTMTKVKLLIEPLKGLNATQMSLCPVRRSNRLAMCPTDRETEKRAKAKESQRRYVQITLSL